LPLILGKQCLKRNALPSLRACSQSHIIFSDIDESDHSNGVFFAGFTIMWEIHEEQNGLVLLIALEEHAHV